MASGYNGTTKTNNSIAGAKGNGTQTGDRTEAAPKGKTGTYKDHYGAGPLKDKQQKPGPGKTGPNMMAETPMDSTGTYDDHNGPDLKDQQFAPAGKKGKSKGKKITSIKQLRDLASKQST